MADSNGLIDMAATVAGWLSYYCARNNRQGSRTQVQSGGGIEAPSQCGHIAGLPPEPNLGQTGRNRYQSCEPCCGGQAGVCFRAYLIAESVVGSGRCY